MDWNEIYKRTFEIAWSLEDLCVVGLEHFRRITLCGGSIGIDGIVQKVVLEAKKGEMSIMGRGTLGAPTSKLLRDPIHFCEGTLNLKVRCVTGSERQNKNI